MRPSTTSLLFLIFLHKTLEVEIRYEFKSHVELLIDMFSLFTPKDSMLRPMIDCIMILIDQDEKTNN